MRPGRPSTWPLAVPAEIAEQSVAVAVNYPSHAQEAGTTPAAPFVFPKRSDSAPWNATFSTDGRLLMDYEVEVGVLTDRPIDDVGDLDDAQLGFVLANDATDRDVIVRASFPQPMRTNAGVAGVSASKSGEGMLQVGPYVVIPTDWRDFMRRVELRLDVNGKVRQRDVPAAMTEGIEAITARMLGADATNAYAIGGRSAELFESGIWQPGTLLLSGTPGGTSFRAPETYPAEGETLTEAATRGRVDDWANAELASGRYLEPGDRIAASGTFLGTLDVPVR